MQTDNGLGRLLEEASLQPAEEVGLFNTHPDIRGVQRWSIEKGRRAELRPYNDYRELCGYQRVTEVDQTSGDARVQDEAWRSSRRRTGCPTSSIATCRGPASTSSA